MGFKEDVERFARKTKLNMDIVVRKVTIDLSSNLIRLSPVKTGRFRGNWVLGVGTPDTSTLPIVDPTGATTQAGIAAKAEAQVRAGGIVYITNSLPYARRLEYGWSKQAPSGMVRITVMNYQQYMANIVRNLR